MHLGEIVIERFTRFQLKPVPGFRTRSDPIHPKDPEIIAEPTPAGTGPDRPPALKIERTDVTLGHPA